MVRVIGVGDGEREREDEQRTKHELHDRDS
jgi:hypothetical protein